MFTFTWIKIMNELNSLKESSWSQKIIDYHEIYILFEIALTSFFGNSLLLLVMRVRRKLYLGVRSLYWLLKNFRSLPQIDASYWVEVSEDKEMEAASSTINTRSLRVGTESSIAFNSKNIDFGWTIALDRYIKFIHNVDRLNFGKKETLRGFLSLVLCSMPNQTCKTILRRI